jgi:ADP-ribosyl-[dinitrogen reductase] hydrolase
MTAALARLVDEAAATSVDDEALRARYRGVLLGVAAGNALGLPVEGESHSSLRRHHPEGVREVDPAERRRPWDDDLAQTVVVAEAALRMQKLSADYLALQLVRWREENGRGIGVLTGAVLDEVSAGRSSEEAARLVWERSGWSNAGNGAVMRCAPVALRWRTSGASLVEAARASAVATHYDERCLWSTVVFDVALAVALSGGEVELDTLARGLDPAGGEDPAAVEQVVEAVREVAGASLPDLELDDPMDMGYTLKAMQVGLWALLQPDPGEELVVEVVSAGGDTDTNGAIAGAAVGARAGVDAIPARWVENVARADDLVGLADRLLEASRRA